MLGFHIARRLLDDPCNQLVLPVRNTDNPRLKALPLNILHADLSNAAQVSRLLTSIRPDVVIHCAATGMRFPKPDWFHMVRFNVASTLSIFEAACELPDCHFIHVSTGLVYRETGRALCESDPLDTLHPYGASKAGADLLIRSAAAEFGGGLRSSGRSPLREYMTLSAGCFRPCCVRPRTESRLPCHGASKSAISVRCRTSPKPW